MKTKVNFDDLKVGDTIKLAYGKVGVVADIDLIADDRSGCLNVTFLIEDGTLDSDDKLSYEEVIGELVYEADALEKDLEEANVMIDALVMERDELKIEAANWKRLAKTLHEAYLEQVDISKAKQDELDFQSEQLEEFMLGDFDDEVTIEFVSLDDLVDTEDELYDPFLADRYS